MAHKAFSESEQEKLAESEAALEDEKVPQTWSERKPSRTPLVGWPGVLIGTGLGIMLAFGGMRLFSHQAAKPAVETKPGQSQTTGQSVTVALVENTPITQTIDVTGTVAARGDLIPVLPQTTGLQIKQVLVQEGQSVQAGQVLAVLDDSVLRAELDQANAQMQSAEAVVGQKQASTAQAQATLREAKQELQRYQALANSGVRLSN